MSANAIKVEKNAKYGVPEFAKPERVSVKSKFGRQYCVAAVVTVPMLGNYKGISLETIILATRKESEGSIDVEFGAMFPRNLKATGDDAEEIRDEFLAHVHSAAPQWAGYDSATDAAFAALTGTKRNTQKIAVPVLVRKDGTRKTAATA